MAETTIRYQIIVRKITRTVSTTATQGGDRIDSKENSEEIYSQEVQELWLNKVICAVNDLVIPEPPKDQQKPAT